MVFESKSVNKLESFYFVCNSFMLIGGLGFGWDYRGEGIRSLTLKYFSYEMTKAFHKYACVVQLISLCEMMRA